MNNLKTAIKNAARNKFFNFLAGVDHYSKQDVVKWQPEAKIVFRQGSTRVLDYGGRGKKILFLSPLINKPNILDFSESNSLMKFLVKSGYHPFLVDWGAPQKEELGFNSDNYIARVKEFYLQHNDMAIGGYCMGGLLALKLAKHVKPKAMILLATPWNFHAPEVPIIEVPEKLINKTLDTFDVVPPELIQSLFINAAPWRVYNKYSTLNNFTEDQKDYFMQVEYWANSGVPMSAPLARECIIDWSLKNKIAKNEWLDVSELDMPVFLACPMKDRIVPIGASIPLAGLLPRAELFKFDCGHIGMLTRRLCFEPLAKWLKTNL